MFIALQLLLPKQQIRAISTGVNARVRYKYP